MINTILKYLKKILIIRTPKGYAIAILIYITIQLIRYKLAN